MEKVSDNSASSVSALSEGIGLLKEINSASTVLIVSIVSACLVLLIIAIVVALLLCKKRQKPSDKYGHNNKNSPDSGYVQNVHPDAADSNLLEHKAFYENLPFHGMNNQGANKDGKDGTAPLAAFDRADDEDLIYADSDYKDVYDYGPVSYREASKAAAAKKKETLDKRFKAALQSHQQPPPITQ